MQLNTDINVLILDDSVPFQTALQQAVSAEPNIRIIGATARNKNADDKIKELMPDAVILNDIPQDGEPLADFISRLRSSSSVPIILVGRGQEESEEIAERFAIDLIRFPDLQIKGGLAAFCNELCEKIKIAAAGSKPAYQSGQLKPQSAGQLSKKAKRFHIIAIGASTGGTEATAEIMAHLPKDIPGIVIVQHMPADFTRMYAERLNRISQLEVSEAKNGDRVEWGKALVAAGGKHMVLKKDVNGYYVKCSEGEKVNGHCPSVGVLFDSAADVAGADAIGVILTGMGRDGAEGLLKMRKAGAYTVGQDQESCVVYGMPMAAYEIGAVMQQAPCKAIAKILMEKTR